MSPHAVDKDAVARNFSEAARSYDRWAVAQAAIADALVERLPAGFEPARIADLGCGTGFLSARLLARYPNAALVGIDLAEGMIDRCRARRIGGDRATFRTGDAEDPSSLPGEVELVASNCAVQWFTDLPGAFRGWAGKLSPGGVLALAALVQGSFPELAAAHAEAFGAPFPGLDFPDARTVAGAVRHAGLRIRSADPVERAAVHAGAREAFRSFRKIGARIPGRAPLGHGEMRRLIAAMARQGNDAGEVTLTHRAIVVIAEKEG